MTRSRIARDRGYAAMVTAVGRHAGDQVQRVGQGRSVAAALREHDLKKMAALLDADPGLGGARRSAIEPADSLGDHDAPGGGH
jgi:hypothetical protein